MIVAGFALWLGVAIVSCLLIVGVANRASQRAAAQSAADVAALAGAAEGEERARSLAKANGAEVTSFVEDGMTVTVRIERDGIAAEARAERQIRPAG